MQKITVTVDGKKVEVPMGSTILRGLHGGGIAGTYPVP